MRDDRQGPGGLPGDTAAPTPARGSAFSGILPESARDPSEPRPWPPTAAPHRHPRHAPENGLESGPGPGPDSRSTPPVDGLCAADLAQARALLAGDRVEAAAWLERQLPALHAFVRVRLGGDPTGVEDVVQETLLTALDQLASYDGRAPFDAWLKGIAKNKLRGARRKRRPKPLADIIEEADAEIDAILVEVDRDPLPDAVLEHRETRELVDAALSQLPLEYRDALTARYYDQQPVVQVGVRLGRSEKAAESLLARARSAFGQVLQVLAGGRMEGLS